MNIHQLVAELRVEEVREQFVIKLLEQGKLSIPEIAEVTSVSEADIIELKKELHK